MAITTKTGTVSYKAGYEYGDRKKGTQSFPYTASYDSETNTTTVTFGTCKHQYFGMNGYQSQAVSTITISAVEDTSIKSSCLFVTNGNTSGSTNLNSFSGSPTISTLVIQHTSDIGDKSIKISVSTVIRCYPSSTNLPNSSQYSGSGSVTISLGNYNGEEISNNAFKNRTSTMAASKWGASGNMVVAALFIPFKTEYDVMTGTTKLTFLSSYIKHRVTKGYSSDLIISGKITITPTDNSSGVQAVDVDYSGTTTDSLKNHVLNYSTNEIVIQHDLTSEETMKYLNVSANINIKFTVKSGEGQETWNLSSSTIVATGTSYEVVIGIPIDDGEAFKFYEAFIDYGNAWQKAEVMLDNRVNWLEAR